jgi:hypothetical protein
MTMHRIVSIIVDRPRIAISWGDGKNTAIDMTAVVARGGIFRSLRNPATFGTVRIGDRGRSLVWTGSDGEVIDFCADALRRQAKGVWSACRGF